MFEYVVKKNGLREEEARWFFQQLIVGLDYCHRMVRRRAGLESDTSEVTQRLLGARHSSSKQQQLGPAPGLLGLASIVARRSCGSWGMHCSMRASSFTRQLQPEYHCVCCKGSRGTNTYGKPCAATELDSRPPIGSSELKHAACWRSAQAQPLLQDEQLAPAACQALLPCIRRRSTWAQHLAYPYTAAF
jgi:hypothetical protein